NELCLYYGAADKVIALAIADMDELMKYVKSCPVPQ
ncbi:glycosidase, partial [Candidatus Aerophobetes bacterium]